MASFGGSSPYPRSLGGADDHVPLLTRSLQSALGNGLSQEENTFVWLESLVEARQIWCSWATNRRAGNIWSPLRCPSELLPRWETMLYLPRDESDVETVRRARWAHRWELFGKEFDWGVLYDEADLALGDNFIQIDTISLANATITVPDGSYPFTGAVVIGNTSPWSSSVMRFLLRVEALPGESDGQFYKKMGDIVVALNPILPAWMSFDWYRAPLDYAPVSAVGGPSAGGFYLDDPRNLDNCVFDE